MPKRDGPITRQKVRIGQLRTRMAELDRERAHVAIQVEEAEAALALLTGKKVDAPQLALEGRDDV